MGSIFVCDAGSIRRLVSREKCMIQNMLRQTQQQNIWAFRSSGDPVLNVNSAVAAYDATDDELEAQVHSPTIYCSARRYRRIFRVKTLSAALSGLMISFLVSNSSKCTRGMGSCLGLRGPFCKGAGVVLIRRLTQKGFPWPTPFAPASMR